MENTKNRYNEMEKYMTLALIGCAVIFLIYLIASGFGIIWLKVIMAIISIITSGLCLAYLYVTKILTAPRSLWITVAASSLLICVLFSLILNFPAPL